MIRERTRKISSQDTKFRGIVYGISFSTILITIFIGIFLMYKGQYTFTALGHSLKEFLFSSDFNPADSVGAKGTVGSVPFILGSFYTCGLALLFATPFAAVSSIFITEVSPRLGEKFLRPTIEIFVAIPSIVYGWTGLVVLVPFIRDLFNLSYGNNIFTAAIVLSVMIFPTIASVMIDSLKGVPKAYKDASYALGTTRWQMIYKVLVPAGKSGMITGIILGLTRAMGEALAVSMVIGKTRNVPKSIFESASTLTSVIASNMGNTFDKTEYNSVLWSMSALLFIISILLIFLIHKAGDRNEQNK